MAMVLLTLEPRRVLILWVQLASAAGTCSASGGATGLERPDRPGDQAVLLYHLLGTESSPDFCTVIKAPFCRASYFRLFQASLDWTFPWIVFDVLHSDTLEILESEDQLISIFSLIQVLRRNHGDESQPPSAVLSWWGGPKSVQRTLTCPCITSLSVTSHKSADATRFHATLQATLWLVQTVLISQCSS